MAQKRGRTNWNLEGVEKTFLETCLQEITLRGREGSSLKPYSWKNVGEKLKMEHNFVVDQKQMKNRYDYTKSKFAAWLKLKSKTGNVYDPITNTFNLSEEEWEIEIKVQALRRVPLSYPELCVQLFEGSTSTGFDSWGPSSTLPHPNEEVFEQNLNGIEDLFECTQGVSDESTVRSKKGGKRKEKSSEDSALLEVRDCITKVAKILIEKHEISNDIDACMDKLESMGWEESDARHQTTLLIFGENDDVRKVWLRLKPHSCELWVKNAGAKYRMF
ncbi:putative Myb/SANT-like domain-containing protein [Helianthus anomalus]